MATIGGAMGGGNWSLVGGKIRPFWRKAGLGVIGLALCEIGARIGLPNLDGRVLSDFILRGGGNPLLRVFDWLVGGALSRGAVLALGIMPYISARIFVRLARISFPTVGELWTHEEGRTKLTRWTRGLTVGLGLVQSYGFARFVQTIPGAVARPGIGFIAETMIVLTTGAICAMVLTEQLTQRTDEDLRVADEDQVASDKDQHVGEMDEEARVEGIGQPKRDDLLLEPGQPPGLESYKSRGDAVGARRGRST